MFRIFPGVQWKAEVIPLRKIFSVLLLLTGLFLILWPVLTSRCNSCLQHQALDTYRQAVSRLDKPTCTRLLEAVEAANDAALLAVDSSGIIGSVAVPGLQICLPIYIGTSESALAAGAGLWEGGSLPIGGAGRHMVLSAHRGLPEARMFRNLDQMQPGDTFTVTVLDRVLTYQVVQILEAVPSDVLALLPREGEDLCTLVTCTPYGINSHRLLVQGQRISVPAL